jgi:hypothetical protein
MARKKKSQHERRSAMPIVNEHAEIVGWTSVDPENRAGTIWHEEAQRLLGAIAPCYVEIDDPEAARMAGAPEGWHGAWRCLAICSESIRRAQNAGDEPVAEIRVRPAVRTTASPRR